MCNNQGIMHLNLNGNVACKNRTAHMYVRVDEFRTVTKQCKRCAAYLTKMDAIAARKADKLVTVAS